MNCTDCINELLAQLNAIPYKWRMQIASAICEDRGNTSGVACPQVKDCETVTSLGPFSRTGTVISVTYEDEKGVITTRTFDFSDILTASLDGIDPKCVTDQITWNSLTYLQRLQAIIDHSCNCCEGNLCPAVDNFVVDGNFGMTWDNSNILLDANALTQVVSKRIKTAGGSFSATGFTPLNPMAKSVFAATTTGTTNKVYEYKVETYCAQGGPTISLSGIKEGITFECIAPVISPAISSTLISIPTTGTDIIKVQFILRDSGNNIIDTLVVNVVAGSAQYSYATAPGSDFTIETVLYALVGGIEVLSNAPTYLNDTCGPVAFSTPAATTTTTSTTTTTTVAPTTTTTTSSTTTTTTAAPSTTTTTTAGGVSQLIRFGAKSGSTPPTEGQILAGSSFSYDPFIDVPVDWTPFNGVPQSCWFAIPDAAGGTAIKNYWFVNAGNNGAIGGGGDLFGVYTLVTVSGVPYKVYITNYDTQFTAVCLLKNSP